MSATTFDPTRISVTESAQAHIAGQIARSGHRFLRLGVKESGCTGYMYVMEEVDAGEEQDVDVSLDNGMHVFVDPGSIGVLRGTELDYVREGINRTLKFKNPNVTAACGCGESFSIE